MDAVLPAFIIFIIMFLIWRGKREGWQRLFDLREEKAPSYPWGEMNPNGRDSLFSDLLMNNDPLLEFLGSEVSHEMGKISSVLSKLL